MGLICTGDPPTRWCEQVKDEPSAAQHTPGSVCWVWAGVVLHELLPWPCWGPKWRYWLVRGGGEAGRRDEDTMWSWAPRLISASGASAAHRATIELLWTWVKASVLFNYRPLCLVMWYMCLVLFIPCNLTRRSWRCPHSVLHPGLSTQRGFASIWVSIPAATPYLFPSLSIALASSSEVFLPVLVGGFIYRMSWKEHGKFKWFWPEDNVYTTGCNTACQCLGWCWVAEAVKKTPTDSAQSYSALEIERKR